MSFVNYIYIYKNKLVPNISMSPIVQVVAQNRIQFRNKIKLKIF